MYKINPQVESLREFTINNRRYLHMHPELSLHEYDTCHYIADQLDKLGIEYIHVGETGLCATIHGGLGEGKILGLRADNDALPIQEENDVPYKSLNPGVMHACGHDGHTATLLTTAKILNENKAKLKGTVKLFFQQSEENGQGARQFVQAGLCQGVDRILGYHGISDLNIGQVIVTPGPNNASCDFFKITIHGKSAHVSQPENGCDALVAGSAIVNQLQTIVSRHIGAIDSVVVGIGKFTSGTAYNIISDLTEIEGTTRTFSQQTRAKVNGLIQSISESICSYYGCQCEVRIDNYANPLINDEMVSHEVEDIANHIVGADNVYTNYEKRLGADDMADFLQEIPGCYFFVGTADERENTHLPHHQCYFDINEDSMLIAASIFVDYANWYLK